MSFDGTTALVVVDVQNDFADDGGSLHVPGADEVLPFINDRIAEANAAGALVVYTQDWHPESTPHFAKDGGIWPVHCVADSWGAGFHPALDVVEGAPVIRKGTEGEDGYSGFSVRDPEDPSRTRPTLLHELLTEHGVDTVVVTGLATDYCVKETALDAARLGYHTVALAEGMRAVDLEPGDGERAFEEMRTAGVEIA